MTDFQTKRTMSMDMEYSLQRENEGKWEEFINIATQFVYGMHMANT
jgi:hypothetical protein